MSESICKCGKKIIWRVTPQGKKIPLDASAPVYLTSKEGDICMRVENYYVSHFCTCKFANDFSKSKAREGK